MPSEGDVGQQAALLTAMLALEGELDSSLHTQFLPWFVVQCIV